MNIFALDWDPKKAAQWHMDSHVVKMPIEGAQLLCTAAWVDRYVGYHPEKLRGKKKQIVTEAIDRERPKDPVNRVVPYLPGTFMNMHLSLWCRSSLSNWLWLRELVRELDHEYQYRWEKDRSHKSRLMVEKMKVPNKLPDHGLQPFSLAMPDDVKGPDPIQAYRRYYMHYKQHLAKWKRRPVPEWYKVEESMCEA